MALNFKRWLLEKLGGATERAPANEILDGDIYELMGEIYIRELCFWSCVNLIGNAVSKCEFKTFFEDREVKNEEYYIWNIEPNKNQNSSEFIHKWIALLYRNNEALIVEQNGQLLVADSYNRTPYALYDDVFTQIQVGDFVFNRSFAQSEVLYFKLSEKNVRQIVNGIYGAYQKMIAYGMKSYQKSRGQRGLLNISAVAQGDKNFERRFDDLMNNRFKTFFEAENAVLPLFNGYAYTDLGSKTYSNEGTRDIRAMIDDVSDFTAKGFLIHPALLNGNVEGTKDALNQTLTFCIDPLVKMLAEEINRKRIGRKGFSEGTYVQIDTRTIKHIDVVDAAPSLDKLICSGAKSVNEVRAILGDPPINEAWANAHFITKNYTDITEFIKSLGGEE